MWLWFFLGLAHITTVKANPALGLGSIQSHASPSKAFSFSTLQSPANNWKWKVVLILRSHRNAWQLTVFLVLLPFLPLCPRNRKQCERHKNKEGLKAKSGEARN